MSYQSRVKLLDINKAPNLVMTAMTLDMEDLEVALSSTVQAADNSMPINGDIAVAIIDELWRGGVLFHTDSSMALAGVKITPAQLGQVVDNIAVVLAHSDAIDTDTFTEATGYLFAIKDDSKQVGFAITPECSIKLADATMTLAEFKQLISDAATVAALKVAVDMDGFGSASGYMHAVVDAAGNIGFGISPDCTMRLGETTITPAELEMAKTGAAATSNSIITIGDSITHGQLHDGVANPVGQNDSSLTKSWPDMLNDDPLLNRTTINRGFSGQTSEHCAAVANALGVLITITGNTIPATTDPVTVTAMDGASYGTISNMGTRIFTGTLFGVRGFLSVTFTSGGTMAPTTFTRDVAGSAVVIPVKTPFMHDENTHGDVIPIPDNKGIGIIMMGINNYFGSDAVNYTGWPARVMSDIRATADKFRNGSGRFVVMTIPAVPVIGTGMTAEDQILLRAVNAEILSTYPDNSIDLHAALMASAEISPPGPAWSAPNYLDPVDAANDEVPRSCTYDGTHFNDKGAGIARDLVRDFILKKGW